MQQIFRKILEIFLFLINSQFTNLILNRCSVAFIQVCVVTSILKTLFVKGI